MATDETTKKIKVKYLAKLLESELTGKNEDYISEAVDETYQTALADVLRIVDKFEHFPLNYHDDVSDQGRFFKNKLLKQIQQLAQKGDKNGN